MIIERPERQNPGDGSIYPREMTNYDHERFARELATRYQDTIQGYRDRHKKRHQNKRGN